MNEIPLQLYQSHNLFSISRVGVLNCNAVNAMQLELEEIAVAFRLDRVRSTMISYFGEMFRFCPRNHEENVWSLFCTILTTFSSPTICVKRCCKIWGGLAFCVGVHLLRKFRGGGRRPIPEVSRHATPHLVCSTSPVIPSFDARSTGRQCSASGCLEMPRWDIPLTNARSLFPLTALAVITRHTLTLLIPLSQSHSIILSSQCCPAVV